MAAQEDEYFSPHDDDPAKLCTLEHAQEDVRIVFKRYRHLAKGNTE